MFCPYAVDQITESHTEFRYDDDTGNPTSQHTIETNKAKFLLCKKEDCGAWNKGRCCYSPSE